MLPEMDKRVEREDLKVAGHRVDPGRNPPSGRPAVFIP
jgi:hypothetical protein